MADQKFGRNKRAPTNSGQRMRTERNKRRHAEAAHARKVQQPHAGRKSADVYGHPPKLNAAEKFVNLCLNLWHARAAKRKEIES